MKNLELTNEHPDINESIVDLILTNPKISSEEKDLAWQRIAPASYFFQLSNNV